MGVIVDFAAAKIVKGIADGQIDVERIPESRLEEIEMAAEGYYATIDGTWNQAKKFWGEINFINHLKGLDP